MSRDNSNQWDHMSRNHLNQQELPLRDKFSKNELQKVAPSLFEFVLCVACVRAGPGGVALLAAPPSAQPGARVTTLNLYSVCVACVRADPGGVALVAAPPSAQPGARDTTPPLTVGV
jgi:hypothetical protein